MKRKGLAAIGLSALLACSALTFPACGEKKGESEKLSYVSLDINPSVELVVDKDNKVVSVRGANEDGQVLLYGEKNVEGAELTAAVKTLTAEAVNLGYLNEDNTVVELTVAASDTKLEAELKGKVNAGLEWTKEQCKLELEISEEGAYSINRRLEALKEKYPDNKAIQDLTLKKFRLALSASETGDITLEAAIDLNEAELIEKIRNADAKLEEYATEAYRKAKAAASEAYDKAIALTANQVYTKFYVESYLKGQHKDTFYYGATYNMYAGAAVGFDYVCKAAESVSAAVEYPLTSEQRAAVQKALGLTDEQMTALENENGDITIASVEAYANKLFKNSETGKELEAKKEALTEALNKAQTEIEEKLSNVYEEYKVQIDAAVATAKSALYTVKVCLPVGMQNMFDDYCKDLTDIVTDIENSLKDGTITLEEMNGFTARLEGKADEYYEKMKNDLSEEEWKSVEEEKAAAIEKMTSEKKQMEDAIADAEKKAKDYLENLKKQHKENSKIHIDITIG